MKIHYAPLFVFICFFVLSFSLGAAAQQFERTDRITKTQANEFYAECLEQSYPADTTEAKELFCSCSAANFYDQLRQGDIMDLQFEETWQARMAKEKLLQFVYTPCIQNTLNDLLADECYSSTYLDDYPHISKNKYCQCQLKRMRIVFEDSMGRIVQDNMQNLDASLSDPISSFMQNAFYQSQSNAITPICMNFATIQLAPIEPIVSYPASVVVTPGGGHGHDHGHGGHDDDHGNESGSSSSNGNSVNPNPQPIQVASAEPAEETPAPKEQPKKVCTAHLDYDEAYKVENVRTDYDSSNDDSN